MASETEAAATLTPVPASMVPLKMAPVAVAAVRPDCTEKVANGALWLLIIEERTKLNPMVPVTVRVEKDVE